MANAIVMLLGTALSLFQASLVPLIVLSIVSFSRLIFNNRKELKKLKPFAGYANWLTALRFIMICVALLVGLGWPPLTLGIVMTVAVLLDVADGYLARKFKQETVFGQFFDMEVDAFFVLIMTLYYNVHESVPLWILVAGVLRYVYVILMFLLPKPNFKEKKRPYASIIAGVFFTILLVSLILPPPYMAILLFVGMALIVISFSISFYEYFTYKVPS